MKDERLILQVLSEQQEEVRGYNSSRWVGRYEERLFDWESDLAQVVIGVRRSGKSTLCHKVLLERGIRYGYVNLDDDRLFGIATEDLNTVLSAVYQLYGADISYLFLDEIQNVEGWHLFVNRLLRQGMHVVVSGSNAKLLSSELATHLVGRYNEIRLYPLSFRELCMQKGVDMESITTKAEAERKRLLNTYLTDGGMPELYKLSNPHTRRVYVESLMETVVMRDIVQRHRIQQVESLRRIANHLINNVCQCIDYGQLKELANLGSLSTVQKYVSYLSQAFLIYRLAPFSFKSRERMTREKVYVIDTGFIANRENSLLPANMGWRLENVVLVELLRRNHSAAEDIYYYRPSSRHKEVDFVVCRQGKVLELLQVAYDISDKKTRKRELEALVQAAEKIGCERLTLVSMCNNEEVCIGIHTIKICNVIDWLLSV